VDASVKSKFKPHEYIPLAVTSAMAILILVVVLYYRSMAVSAESEAWVQHSHLVSSHLENMLYAMTNIDASGRAFMATGEETYLNSWRSGITDLKQHLQAVRVLTWDDPAQQARLPALDALVAERTQFDERINALPRTQGRQAAAQAVRSGEGPQLTNEFRQIVQVMQDEETQLLDGRTADAKRRLLEARIGLLVGTALGLLITGATGISVIRGMRGRRLGEEALRISEEQYRTLLNEVHDHAIFMLDPSGHVVTWNAGAERITGYSASEIIGRNFACFFPPTDVAGGKPAEMLKITAAGGRHEEHGRRVRKNGSQYVSSTTYTALRNRDGGLRGFSEITRDLSETKESGAKYLGLLEAAPDAMVVVNQSGDIVLVNLQAEKQFGYRRDELLGQKVSSIVPYGFAERLVADGLRSAEDALAQQIGTGIELTARRKDGSEFPIEIMLSPLRSPEGILVTAAIRDISVRRAADAHLMRMEGRYRGLLEAAPDAMVVVNEQGEIVLLNLQAEKQFGYRRDELLGQKLTNIIPEGFAERLIADGLRSAEDALAQQIGTGLELTALRKDGSRFPMELMLSPLQSDTGTLVTVAIRNITLRNAASIELLHTVEELKRSNEDLQQFAYVASHDLQEPLRMVASYVALIARRYKGKLDADADEFISFAVDGAKRMQSLIQDLLAFSRVGSKGVELVRTSSEDALNRAIKNLRVAIADSGAQVTHDPLPSVLADEIQLTQLFQNLLGNAIKYRRAETPGVHIAARQSGPRKWIFSVQDNGLGIESQYFERIFGMFQRLHGREEFSGTGMGLAICKKIVERHGGDISVESTVGQGSTFRFPLTASERAA
jgi:PAS domain S-box-containing protein